MLRRRVNVVEDTMVSLLPQIPHDVDGHSVEVSPPIGRHPQSCHMIQLVPYFSCSPWGPDREKQERSPVPTPSQESLKITQEDLFFKVLKQTSEFRIVRFFFFKKNQGLEGERERNRLKIWVKNSENALKTNKVVLLIPACIFSFLKYKLPILQVSTESSQ